MSSNEQQRPYERSIDEINNVLKLAKLNQNDLLPMSQTIYFANDLHTQDNYKLLQMNPKIQEQLKIGSTLYITGSCEDNVVLCSEDTTYEVVNTETSNSLLLAKNLKFSEDAANEHKVSEVVVDGVFYEYLEMVQKKPQFHKLEVLLDQSTYRGPEHEYNIDQSKLYTFDELWPLVQASKAELMVALKEHDTITINNKIRALEFEYHFRVLSYMLKIIEENSWRLDEVDYDVTIESLSDIVPLEVLTAVFELHTIETKIRDGCQLYKYNEENVCKLFAQVLLFSAGKFNLNEFIQAWQDSVPEGMQTDLNMLNGMAIIDRKAVPCVIWSFPENKLPQNIIERLKVLFNTKAKWTVDEISPYMINLTSDKQDVNTLLTKYARCSKVDGVKYYSSKHGK